jgi:hypothetical protein
VREQHTAVIAQANTTAAPDKKAPDPQKKDGRSDEPRQPEAPPGQNDKKPPPRDFVPSEKIDADKAVDFPVDI